jgi:hypothetical protein
MWVFLRKLLSRSSKTLNAVFGDVVFTTPQEHGASTRSFFEWRVKRSVDNGQIYIAVAMLADASAGREGSPTNYIHFDLDSAVRLRDNLNNCIEFARQQSASVGRPPSGSYHVPLLKR